VRYEWTERFAGDWRRLSEQHRALFRVAVPEFSKACDAYVEAGDAAVFPAHLGYCLQPDGPLSLPESLRHGSFHPPRLSPNSGGTLATALVYGCPVPSDVSHRQGADLG
jgi:hypothetical protein